MNRRTFIKLGLLGAAGFAAHRAWPDGGLFNPCISEPLPPRLADHDVVRAAWDGLDPANVWDCHVHLIGVGDGETGVWITPKMSSWLHPIQSVQKYFYQNAGCAERTGHVDADFRERLLNLANELRPGAKCMLLAFDYHHDENGARDLEHSAYHTPDHYAARVAREHPDRFEWMASIHPYRLDAVTALEHAAANGARGVKWLPPAMGMDPASPKCDAFYEALARLNIPLLTHGGEELAVHGGAAEAFGNPLRLRRPLEHGVRVIVAHCASLGASVDLDKGENGPQVDNFELFARLMNEPRHEGRLFGEISALTQINRMGNALRQVIARSEWHHRLVNGSDYPLPGILPLFSLKRFVDENYIDAVTAEILAGIRNYNALLFDFLLKRHLTTNGKKLGNAAFETRRVFDSPASRDGK
jgi:mannonate dehydratase